MLACSREHGLHLLNTIQPQILKLIGFDILSLNIHGRYAEIINPRTNREVYATR